MKRLRVVIPLVVAGVVGLVSTALAESKAEMLVEQRQAAMILLGKYFGPLGGMLKGKVTYDAKVVVRNAEFMEALAKMPWDGFDPSTQGAKSAALPAVFANGAKFKEAGEHLQAETAKLVSLAKSGDEAAVKAQVGAVGKACGSCHDDFRAKD